MFQPAKTTRGPGAERRGAPLPGAEVLERSGTPVAGGEPLDSRLAPLLAELLGGPGPEEPALRISAAIGELDRRIHAQLNAVLSAAPFRALESAWNSLEWLVAQAPEDRMVQIHVLNVSRREIDEDLEDAIEFDRSTLFDLVYERAFGSFGGEPYAAIVLDFEFAHSVEDVEALRALAGIGAAAHAVLLAGASPELLGKDSWTEISLQTIPLDGEARSGLMPPRWSELREYVDTRYLGLVMPPFLLRLPHRPTDPTSRLGFWEDDSAPDASGRLWGNSAYALASRVMDSFHRYGWSAAIRGLEEGRGVVADLPVDSLDTEAPGLVVRPPVQLCVIELQEKALSDLGLIPLCRVAASSRLSFFGVSSLYRPPVVDDPILTTNLKLSAQLPYILAASRFAHYIKAIVRDHVGRFTNRAEVHREVSNFLARYTLDDDNPTKERQARWPLRAFQVEIRDRPGKPGHFEAVVDLRPHFQIEDPTVSLRLRVDLPEPVNPSAPGGAVR